MKMNEVKSRTWFKIAEIKTKAKTLKGIYKAVRKEFGDGMYDGVSTVADDIRDGYIQICDDGIIIWVS